MLAFESLLLRQAPNAEQRIVNRLAAADRAFAGRRHPVALGKNEPAPPALGRGYRKHRAEGVQAAADMFEMGGDLLFREVDSDGDILCRDRPLGEKRGDGMAGGFLGSGGGHWFSRFVLHGVSLEIASMGSQAGEAI